MNTSTSETSKPRFRWYSITPNRVLIALLVWTCFLYLSKHFVWFEFNRHKGWTVLIAVASLVVVLLAFGLWGLASWLWRLRTNRSAPAFQFSLATLLLFVPVVGITCGWFGDELRQARKQEAIVKVLKGQGANLQRDDSNLGPNLIPKFCQDWLGQDFFGEVVLIATYDPAGLVHLKDLKQLQNLALEGTSITDAGLEHLKALTQLQSLILYGTSITDVGLEHLKGLTQLRRLTLDKTPITDAGLEHLKALTQLESLTLNGTSITDVGLEHLKGLTQLQKLYLGHPPITIAGFMEIEKALPNCHIWPSPSSYNGRK